MNPLFNLYGFHDQISRGRKGLTILTPRMDEMLRLLLGVLIKLCKRGRNQGPEQVAEPQKG